MSDPPLERVEELFHRAAEMNPEQRAAFLEIECAGDIDLKSAVEALLKHDRESTDATDFLESPILRSARQRDSATLKPGLDGSYPTSESSIPVIPGYEILEELGRGGMGVVYKARQTGLNRLVALKMLLSVGPVSREDLARFRVEAESLAQLHHPNIVQIYEISEHEGLPYFAMEYVPGPSLAQQMGGAAQAPQAAAHLVEILAGAMSVVHQRGIIHRDLKPANVLLSDEFRVMSDESKNTIRVSHTSHITHDSSLIPKITDFGLAKRFEGKGIDAAHAGAATQTGTVIGTPFYMPPEQARGDISGLGPWTDIYSLGAIFYELLTGRPPIQESNPTLTLMKVLSDDPLPPSHWRRGLSRDLDTICLKCLEKDPIKRYAGAGELAEDLRRFQAGQPIRARPIGFVEHIWRWCRRQPLAATALASTGALGLALLITVIVYNARLREELAKEVRLSEDRRVQLVYVSIAVREMDSGDAFTALLWLTEALKLDETNANHRQLILQILEKVPWLIRVGTCDGHVLASRFTADDCRLAAVQPDHSIRIWDVMTGRYFGPRLKHTEEVLLAEFSPDGQLLATASVDGAVRLWRLDSGKSDLLSEPTKTSGADAALFAGSQVKRLVFDPSGKFLLTQSGESTVRCYSITTGKVVSLADPMDNSLLSPDGRFVFSMDSSGMTKLWNVSEDKATTAPIKIEGTAQEVGGSNLIPSALSMDGKWVAIVDGKNTVRIAETATGKIRGKSLTHHQPVERVIFGPRGENVLTIDKAQYARVWRWENLQPGDLPWVMVSSGSKEGQVVMAHFDLKGRFLAALGNDHRLRIWDVTSHTQATPPLHPRDTLDFEAFSEDGKRLVVVGKDHTVRLWDLSPCASNEAQRDHAIQPGMKREFTLPHLSALVQELAGAHLDEQKHVVPLDQEGVLATWKRYKDLQKTNEGTQ